MCDFQCKSLLLHTLQSDSVTYNTTNVLVVSFLNEIKRKIKTPDASQLRVQYIQIKNSVCISYGHIVFISIILLLNTHHRQRRGRQLKADKITLSSQSFLIKEILAAPACN